MRIPLSQVKGDLPKAIVSECAAELASPLALIFNRIIKTQIYPQNWKMETLIVLKKVPDP